MGIHISQYYTQISILLYTCAKALDHLNAFREVMKDAKIFGSLKGLCRFLQSACIIPPSNDSKHYKVFCFFRSGQDVVFSASSL